MMDIAAVIAEATNVAPEPTASTEATTEVTEPAKEVEDLSKKQDSELTPEQLDKREANRQSHLNSKLAKQRREIRELREANTKLSQAPAATQASTKPTKPNESNYSDWEKLQTDTEAYHEALADWKVEQKLAERDTKSAETTKLDTIQAQKLERINQIAANEEAFAKANPEYKALYQEHSDFMNSLPLPIAEALMEADSAELALFALMKEGRLETLEDMSPSRIAIEIGKAEIRGEQYLNTNKATNAPTPIQAARGTGNSGKSLEQKSVAELMKQFNSR